MRYKLHNWNSRILFHMVNFIKSLPRSSPFHKLERDLMNSLTTSIWGSSLKSISISSVFREAFILFLTGLEILEAF